ncbi:OmpP1/FadL family transporter [Motiliproteus sediminis]|uniref:OmpP1/FadL family transporter n=1 Tax=Motiliproteus sediminis TaxID=1468178 RepID=UPI001AF013D0|nr:outer membrane protein transport protein [Motiliproteus sediminis]
MKVLLPAFLVSSALQANAAGLWLYEQGSSDMGLSAAGRAALGRDASTAGNNPAAMTRLTQNQSTASLLLLDVSSKFSINSSSDPISSPLGTGNGGDAGDLVPAGGISYVHVLNEKVRIGMAFGSYFGLGLAYDNDWAGRYFVQEAELLTMGLNPSVGYRVNDQLSIGGGIAVVYGDLSQDVAVNNVIPGQTDGRLSLESDDVGYGFNLGLLYEFSPSTRLGLTYRSEIDLKFDDAAKLSNVLPPLSTAINAAGLTNSPVGLEMSVPQAIMFSAFHQLDETWALTGNIGWQEWSKFGESSILIGSSSPTTLVSDRQFEDTWHIALGALYHWSEKVTVSAGVGYDESPVSGQNRTLDLPLDRQVRISTGVQYQLNPTTEIGVAYSYIDLGDAAVNQSRPLGGTVQGDYSTNRIHALGGNISWRF